MNSAGKTLCLNMIVKNEMANLPRCLGAIADHIACWVIGDTGSTDGSQDFIRGFFAARDLPGELHSFPFENFEQARNAALDCAAASPLAYDYLLLADADMELVVEDLDFRTKLHAPAYQLIQRSSGLSYGNSRLVQRGAGARYHGVTHEYLAIPGGTQQLDGVWYRDHASGANRVDKYERDIRLLRGALETDPDNHRHWFYLAQSYRDAGRIQEAADGYAKRAGMGGWKEEAWCARLNEARCLLRLGNEGGFLRAALAAFDMRSQRAEPLYDLARHYRQRGMHNASVLFSEPGLAVPRPGRDGLFIEDFVYSAGLREEYSIAANYSGDPARKNRGHATCDWLALSREAPQRSRDLARFNLFFYIQPANVLMPSFAPQRVGFTPPEGWHTTTACITRHGDEVVMVQCCEKLDGVSATPEGSPMGTQNFLLRIDASLGIETSAEIRPAPFPDGMPGLSGDPRLFTWHGALWCIFTMRQRTSEGRCDQMLARIDSPAIGPCRLVDWRVLRPEEPGRHEAKWMPLVSGDKLRFIFGYDPFLMVDEQVRMVMQATPAIAADGFRGGSQAIAFDGGWLALVHEVEERDKKRFHWHRFVWFDAAYASQSASRRFFFQSKGNELAAGLAWHPDGKRLLISFGADDGEAWLATVEAEEVRAITPEARASLPVPTVRSTFNVGPPVKVAPVIPRILHFITGLDRDFGGRPFSFVHYMAIRSALLVNKNFTARVYYHYEPSGMYWDLIRPDVELVSVEAPNEVFGNPVQHFAHKADVLRMRLMLEHGGIYLDLDTICQRPFEPLLDGSVVLGREERRLADGSRAVVGLCNATIIAPPGAEFLRLWYDAYRDFSGGTWGDAWNKFSVQVPLALARAHPDLLRIEPATSFFWPDWTKDGIEALFCQNLDFPEAYSFHLWQGESWAMTKDLDAEAIRTVDTTYNKIARRFLPPGLLSTPGRGSDSETEFAGKIREMDGNSYEATEDMGRPLSADGEAREVPSRPDAKHLSSGTRHEGDAGGGAPIALSEGRSFDLFDTLVARRCVHPLEIFHSVERLSGHTGFANARCSAEEEVSSGQYSLDDIYRRLVEHHDIAANISNRLKKLELETEAANLFPILEHCREVGPNDVVVSDMYLPPELLGEIVRKTCGVHPRRLYVSSHGKRNGTVWPVIRQRMTITEHVGDNPVTDQESAKLAGIPARLTTVAYRSEVEDELAAAGFAPLANLIREARLTTWHDDPAMRRAQVAQVQVNFPLLFLATLHLQKQSAAHGWDHILMSGRDCYLWHKLYQGVRLLLPEAPTVAYFYTSRVARAHPSPSYLAYFAEQCRGQHNVVVDVCGTGWSLSRLIDQAPELPVDIFLLHKLEMADWVRDYYRYGTLAHPIAVHSIIARAHKNWDAEVLERLNLAPHEQVENVVRGVGGFQPVFSSLRYEIDLSEFIGVHHAAFEQARGLLRYITTADMATMLDKDIVSAIEAIYSRMSRMFSEVERFTEHKNQEESQTREALRQASLRASTQRMESDRGSPESELLQDPPPMSERVVVTIS